MKNSFFSHIKHPIFLGGVVVVLAISGAGFAYYRASQIPPQYNYVEAKLGTAVETVTDTGAVKAASEVDMSFQTSGQVAQVYAVVGTQVSTGQLLASLTNDDASAQLALAQANAQAAQAKLDSLKQGTRPEQLAIDQTSVDQAKLALSNSYSGATTVLQNDYISANDAVRKQMGAFFNNANQSSVSLAFQTSDSQSKIYAENGRMAINAELDSWQTAVAQLGLQSDPSTIDGAITDAETRLGDVQSFLNILNDVLKGQVNISANNLPAYQASITGAQTEISNSLAATIGLKQTFTSETAAVTQAQNNLNLAEAGATANDIAAQSAAVAAAQAAVLNAQAQLEKTLIRAPIAGMITKSEVKVGANVSPNVPVISLISNGKFQVETYLAEDDVANVKVGDQASVTLDAYGSEVSFPASVISVDSAQTIVNGSPAYKAVLEFANDDARLKADLTANVSIVTATHADVLEVPASAIIRRDPNYFVLVDAGTAKPEERQVEIGIQDASGMVEIVSGLSAGDKIVNFGSAAAL